MKFTFTQFFQTALCLGMIAIGLTAYLSIEGVPNKTKIKPSRTPTTITAQKSFDLSKQPLTFTFEVSDGYRIIWTNPPKKISWMLTSEQKFNWLKNR